MKQWFDKEWAAAITILALVVGLVLFTILFEVRI